MDVIDLSDPERTCSSFDAEELASLADPLSVHGTFVGGELLVCGGGKDECFTYDDRGQQWKAGPERQFERFLEYGIDMGDDQHWVTGGNEMISEMFDGTDFTASVNISLSTRGHCVVKIEEDKAMIMTGK